MHSHGKITRAGGPIVALIVLLCWLGVGCSNSRIVEIDSIPQGASIYVNGEKRGTTPDKVNVVFKGTEDRLIIQLVMAGKKPIFQAWTLLEVPPDKTFTLRDE